MAPVSFSQEEKAALFERICGEYYQQNFGRLSKTEMELMMFRFFLDHYTDDPAQRLAGERVGSDEVIGRELGITARRVGDLRLKREWAESTERLWRDVMKKLLCDGCYDYHYRRLAIPFSTPETLRSVRDFLSMQGAPTQTDAAGNTLFLRIEYYLQVLVMLEPEFVRRRLMVELRQLHPTLREESCQPQELGELIIGERLGIGEVIRTAAALTRGGELWELLREMFHLQKK